MAREVTLRKALPEDAGALHRLNELFNGAGSNTADRIAASLQYNGQELVALAVIAGQPVGFACGQVFRSLCYSVNYGEISELFVEEAFRSQGVGGRLLAYMEELFREQGIHHVQLFTGADNTGAQRFYERSGYQKSTEIMYRKR